MQAFFNYSEGNQHDRGMPGGRPATKEASFLGSLIAQARQQAGLSQYELADKLSVSRNLIAQWERSAVALKAEQLLALSETLGVTVDVLLGRGETIKRGTGPAGRARQVFERVSKLPRATQQRILANVEDALTAYEVRKAG
ncbi:MAG: helix-turn-helix domain-containing protein [Opitutaceae bacterium]